MTRHKIGKLREKLPEERRKKIEARVHKELEEMALADIRKAMRLTQVDIAERMSRAQGNISDIEHRADMFISTLRDYIMALGGELEIRARFPGPIEILINQFEDMDIVQAR